MGICFISHLGKHGKCPQCGASFDRDYTSRVHWGMALRKGKIVEAAGVQRSKGAGEKEEI
jgi:hypothetical protein